LVFSDELWQSVGPTHQWSEVWEGRVIAATGVLHYNSTGDLQRADIEEFEEISGPM
jgi:hypothetical protein